MYRQGYLRYAENDHVGAVGRLDMGGGGTQGQEGGAACHPRSGQNSEKILNDFRHDTSGNFSSHVSLKSPIKISPNP